MINFEKYVKTGKKGPSVYTDELICEILDKVYAGQIMNRLSKEYDIPTSTISNWINGNYRKDVTGDGLYEKYKREHLDES